MSEGERTGKGLPPEAACYATGTDHRRQVEAADARRAKRRDAKARRRLDARIVRGDESAPKDIFTNLIIRHHTGEGKA